MKRPVHTAGIVCALAACCAPLPSRGAPATTFSGEVGVGGEYDSNVAVNELDVSSHEGDYALLLDAQLKLAHNFNALTDMTLTYNFSDTAYKKFNRLDRQTHLLGADIARNLGWATSGATVYYVNARLDGDDFLTYYRGSPYISGFLSKKWFARGAYVFADKKIAQNSGRDASINAFELDFYYFFRGLRSYFNFGYRYNEENANAAEYDYSANSFKLRYIRRWDLFEKPLKLEASWRYEDRDYRAVTPSIGEDRHDERNRWSLELGYQVMDKGAIQLFSGYANYDSNYPSADYNQYIIGSRFSWSF